MSTLKTKWADEAVSSLPHNEYPRPQLARENWQNLNGEYEYAIKSTSDDSFPMFFDGKIIVPFCIESSLSGVCRKLESDEYLWYKKIFKTDECFKNKKVMLNFEAVDFEAVVYINKKAVAKHRGGYVPFSVDITDALNDSENELLIRVYDPTDTLPQPSGKQAMESHGFWYTGTSGIWQSVWLEPVEKLHVVNLKMSPDIDNECIGIKTACSGAATIEACVYDNGKVIFNGTIKNDDKISIPSPKLWSPENPFLYDIEIKAYDNDSKLCDTIKSYFGMRKFSIGNDDSGIMRLMLNNKPYFQKGLLDQGYWCDGILTPPTDEAMIYDIQKMKDLGFNMLRKHIKVEMRRWYYHCDKIGMLVWQDMVSGQERMDMALVGMLPTMTFTKIKDDKYAWFGRNEKEWRDEFERELFDVINHLYNCTCISTWVPFNEGWGQFDAKRIGEAVKKYDPSRIVDHASGWHDQNGPELNSMHRYVLPVTLRKDDKRPFVLSEYGGYSMIIIDHVWNEKKSFGYQMYKDKASLTKAYKKLHEKQIIPLIKKGLSATVYTQVSDVEFEVNGILSYDREFVKIDENVIKEINAAMTL